MTAFDWFLSVVALLFFFESPYLSDVVCYTVGGILIGVILVRWSQYRQEHP